MSNSVALDDWVVMTYSNNIYTCEMPYTSGITIKFNNNSYGDHFYESNNLSLVENGVYKWDEQVTTVPVSITNDHGTFASPYPLTFPEEAIRWMTP